MQPITNNFAAALQFILSSFGEFGLEEKKYNFFLSKDPTRMSWPLWSMPFKYDMFAVIEVVIPILFSYLHIHSFSQLHAEMDPHAWPTLPQVHTCSSLCEFDDFFLKKFTQPLLFCPFFLSVTKCRWKIPYLPVNSELQNQVLDPPLLSILFILPHACFLLV